MRNLLCTALALLLAASPALAQTDATADGLMDRFAEAWSADDSTAVSEMLAADVVLIGGDGEAIGTDAIESWRRRQMAGTGAMEVQPLQSGTSGDLAYQTGRWSLGLGDDGSAGTATGTHSIVFRRGEDGAWRIASMSITNDPRE